MTVLSNIITPSNVLTTTNTATVTNKTLTSPTVAGMTVSDGTANGVTFLNGSKVLTSGSALTFNGAQLGVVNASGTAILKLDGTSAPEIDFVSSGVVKSYIYAPSTSLQLNTVGSNPIIFLPNEAEGMRLTSTGLGIGTTSPSVKLQVKGGNGNQAVFDNAGERFTQVNWNNNGTGKGAIWIDNTNSLFELFGYSGVGMTFSTGGSERMRLDTSGNLGLGVTPSAWGSGIAAIDVNTVGSFVASTGSTLSTLNCYYNAGWKYKTTGTATYYDQTVGTHAWYTAASGTAGNAISFTQAMTLGSDGNLAVGTTSTSGARLKVDGGATSGTIGQFGNAQGGVILGAASSVAYVDTTSSTPLAFRIDGTERARIDSSGNLLVGTTSQFLSEKLSVNTGNTVGIGVKTTGGASNATVGCWNATTTGDANFVFFATETSITVRGSIDYNRAGGLTRYNTTSDYRAKDISGPVTNSGALIDSVPVYMGKMKWATEERPMFIAHEVPTYAHTGTKDEVDADGKPVYQQMDASALIPVMWAEIQSLRQRLSAANL